MEKLPEDRLNKFKEIIRKAKSDIAIILSHLDPDSVACAMLFSIICIHLKKNVNIFYAGGLFHPQNRAIWNRFTLADNFTPLEKLEDVDKYDTVLLDSSDLNDSRLGGLEINPIIVIDHHLSKDKLEETENTWYQIKSCGAATTLVAQLYLSLGLKFEQGDDVSTISVIALLTDADIKLISKYVTVIDRQLYVELMEYADASRIRETFASVKDKTYLGLFKKAIDNMDDTGNITVTSLDFIDEDDFGYIALIADELCAISGINTVVIWAMRKDGSTEIKVRTVDDKIELDSFIKKRFGEKKGGARHGKGAARLLPPNEDWQANSPAAKKALLKYRHQWIIDKLTISSSE